MSEMKVIPLYQQIFDDFRLKIIRGEWKAGDPLPSQLELASLYNTSEMTIRKALTLLTEQGLIYRIRKKGSFIGTKPQAALTKSNSLEKVYFVHRKSKMNLLNQSFYQSMFEGIRQVCLEQGAGFHLLGIDDQFNLPDEPKAGYIMFDVLHNLNAELLDTLERWKAENRSLVTIQFYFPHLQFPYVVGDNVTGGYLATQHLLSLGHKRIGIILTGRSSHDINAEFALRLQGYRMALNSFNIPFDPGLIIIKDAEEEVIASGYEGFCEFMALENPPTAIFAASDFKALGALYAALDRNIKVPEEISIIGYDGQPFTEFTIPRLTTVNQNTFMFGVQAANAVFHQFQFGKTTPESLIAPQLIVRDSTGEPPGTA